MNGAKARYDAKTYETVTVKLHKVKDRDIIEGVAKLAAGGKSRTDAVKEALRKGLA